jgi:hypothetical protein
LSFSSSPLILFGLAFLFLFRIIARACLFQTASSAAGDLTSSLLSSIHSRPFKAFSFPLLLFDCRWVFFFFF